MNIKDLPQGSYTPVSSSTPLNIKDLPQGSYSALDSFSSMETAKPRSSLMEGLVAGAKATANVPKSAYNMGKSLVSIAKDPKTALDGFANLVAGGAANATRQVLEKTSLKPKLDNTPLTDQEQAFKSVLQFANERYGTSFGDKKFSFDEMLQTLEKTATEDPFGFGSDVFGLAAGGATLVGKGAQAANLTSKIAQTATAPLRVSKDAVKSGITNTAKFSTSQATGLNPETIQQVIKNPDAFGKAAENTSRTQLADAVGKALDSRLDELSDIGSAYDELRKTGGKVTIPDSLIPGVLDKYGIKIKDGKIQTTPESTPLEPGDRAALENFITNYGSATQLSNNGFLNVRKALSNLSKYDGSKSDISTTLARDLRASYDAIGKDQIEGLHTLDALYAPERQTLNQLKKDIFNPQGELKDGAISKIANLTGKGKEKLLERMKEIVPDIEQRVEVLRAVEDIEASSGIKVGTYTRAATAGAGLMTGNIPVIIGAILSQPQVAVPLLRAYGYTGAKAAEVLQPLRTILHDVNNFTIPTPLVNYLKDKQPGLSTKSVLPEGVPVPKNIIKEMTAKDFLNIQRHLDADPKNAKEYIETGSLFETTTDRLGLTEKFASDDALKAYMRDVLEEWQMQGTEGGIIEGLTQ